MESLGTHTVVPIFICNVGERENVQLGLARSTGGVDGKQDRPGDTATDETDCHTDLQESQQEVAVERIVL